MNAIEHPNIYMRSLATRDAGSEIARRCPTSIAACKVAGFDLVIVETSGIGQGDAAIVPLVDVSLYVMTPEFGAATPAREDRHARLRRLRRDQQVRPQGRRRTRCATCASSTSATASCSTTPPDEMPVFGTIAARFNDDGVTALYQALAARLAGKGLQARAGQAAAGRGQAVDRPERHRAAGARALPRRDRRDGARLPPAGRGEQARHRARAPAAARGEGGCSPRECEARTSRELRRASTADRDATRSSTPARRSCSTCGRRRKAVRRRRVRGEDPRQGDPHGADHDVAVRHADPQGRAAAASRTTARSCAGS